jgi:serine/threonine protein kinase
MDSITHTGGAGSEPWKAPELNDHDDDDDPPTRKSAASDVWAFSCTVLEVRSGFVTKSRSQRLAVHGMILPAYLQIFSGQYPYAYLRRGKTVHVGLLTLLQAISKGELPAKVRPDKNINPLVRCTMPIELWELLIRCWNKDPSQRPKMTEAKHSIVILRVLRREAAH